ncbi:MAG: DUF4382 domain-containing protein [Flavobacterium sp.]
MKKFNSNALRILALLSFILLFLSCNDSDEGQASTSRVDVRMTDAPGDFESVNVEILDVLIKSNLNADDQGWVSIGNGTPQIYNLLDLTGGVSILLADHIVPSGNLGQIRLLLGDDNTVVKDGVTYPLKTPSAQQSGLKLNINTLLQPGVTYDFLLDFDVESSVVTTGVPGDFILKPVIRVVSNANSGVIKGTVLPLGIQILASVEVNGVVISSYADAQGHFQLNGVPAGTYTVKLTPDPASELPIITVENVVVINGQITDIGSHVLQ